MRLLLKFGFAAMVLTLAGASQAQAQMRFQALDRNNDGMISRSEWNGTNQTFSNQDWNGDGVLSGDEVLPGARRQTGWNQDWNHDGIIDRQDTLIAQRFRNYDIDGDRRVAVDEWPGNQMLFSRLDANRDGFLTMAEYTNNGGFRADSQGGPASTFASLDRNRDGWITRNEWNVDAATFNRLDVNRDNRISNVEFQNDTVGNQQTDQDFVAIDRNRDGWVTRGESGMTNAEFNRLDTNSDNRLSRFEFENDSTVAYQPADQDFVAIDRNRDGWITRGEAGMTNAEFNRLDTNSDNRLSRYEFDASPATTWNSAFMNAPFQGVDVNRDGWVTRAEWQWDAATFNRVDTNTDGRISRFEFETAAGQGVTADRFLAVDRNRDNYIARSEWSWGDDWFDRTDTNHDDRISRAEFDASSRYFNETTARYEDNTYYGYDQPNQQQQNQRTRAYQAGFDRGVDEGRMAGREDRSNGHGWDLEGQTELERADSGYYSQLGSLSEYQSGYREGFRGAYREGYNAR